MGGYFQHDATAVLPQLLWTTVCWGCQLQIIHLNSLFISATGLKNELYRNFFFFFWSSNRNDENMHTVESDHIFQVWFIADSCPKNFSLEPASPFLSAAAAETVWRGDVNSRQASYLAFLPCQMHQRQEITQLAKIYHTVSPKVKTGFSYSKANAVFCHR